MVDRKFLEDVFSKQPGKYIGLSAKLSSGRWIDRFFSDIGSAIKWVEKQPEGANLYFCPTKLEERRRVKRNVSPSKFLYSDLDEADPNTFTADLRPSHAWESSPGRYQALWELLEPASPKALEEKNKGLAYSLAHLGADTGGWDLTQVLRIPGTKNYKYEDAPEVRTLWSGNTPKGIDSYPSANGRAKDDVSKLLSVSSVNLTKLIKKWRKRIPKKALNLLLSKHAERGKRSDILWYLSHALIDAGVPDKEAFSLIRASVWNKYRGRADEVERLSHEISEARQQRDSIEEEDDSARLTDALKSTLTITSHADLMANPAASPGWLVENFWTRESHGIIAGEPKSFKSTILLDFVVSIASGEPFLGEFEVKESGPVVVVQNENSDWIMQDRLNKITTQKGISGRSKRVKGGMQIVAPLELPIFYINQQGFLFSDPTHQDQLEEFIARARPIAVIFDPLYLMFDGDVNSAKDLGPALSWLLYLKQEYSTSIMLVHHWGKNKSAKRGGQRMLGSTTLHGWIESAWYIGVQGAVEEEDKTSTDIHKQASSILLTLEREFRGAGTYPKVDITISMGDFGSRTYQTSVEKHRGLGRPKRDRGRISDDVIAYLEMNTRPVSVRSLAESTGIGRRILSETVATLLDSKLVLKDKSNKLMLNREAISGRGI